MRFIFEQNENQKKISEFMIENEDICMADLIGYICNHLSKYPTMHKVYDEYQAENKRVFSVTIKEKDE